MSSGAAHNLDQEFWRPPEHRVSSPVVNVPTEVCPRCNNDYIAGAHFCHVCGLERQEHPTFTASPLTHYLDIRVIRDALHLNTAALVAFICGLGCAIAAIVTGFMYTATTLLDWQAVQVWRIEWLLAATVCLVAGILLNRSN